MRLKTYYEQLAVSLDQMQFDIREDRKEFTSEMDALLESIEQSLKVAKREADRLAENEATMEEYFNGEGYARP